MRSMKMHPALAACAMLGWTVGSALGADFAIVGTAPGNAQIGGISGTTLYGTLPWNNDGVLFSLSTGGTYTVLHNFSAGTDGSAPNARLAIDKAGNVYGTAPSGGVHSGGTMWEYTASGTMQVVHAFGAGGDGTAPMQGPTLSEHGAVVGTTGEGAIGGSGNLFSVNKAGAYTVLYEFMSGEDGHCPFSGVAVASDGTLYGTTVGVGYGGNPNGSVWAYSPQAGLQTLYVFKDGDDGEWPTQAPTLDNHGNLFGTTATQNGNSVPGAIWKINAATGAFSILHQMNGSTDGSGPNSPLIADGEGGFYGTTGSGGTANLGTIFSIGRQGAFHVVHQFSGGSDGGSPTGNLVRAHDGTIYGGTGTGQVFAITP